MLVLVFRVNVGVEGVEEYRSEEVTMSVKAPSIEGRGEMSLGLRRQRGMIALLAMKGTLVPPKSVL